MAWFRAALGGAVAAAAVAAAASLWLFARDESAPPAAAETARAAPSAPAPADPGPSAAAASREPASAAATPRAPSPQAVAPAPTEREPADGVAAIALSALAPETATAPVVEGPPPASPVAPAGAPAVAEAPPPTGPAAGEAARLAPRFDVVRVEPDGSAVFAGVAEPDALIEVRIGEQVVASGRAGRDGGFVAFGDTRVAGAGEGVQRIELAARAPDGALSVSAAPVFVAPPRSDDGDAPAPLVIRADAEGVEVVQRPVAAGPVGGVTLETVSYGADGVVEMGGRAEGLQRVRIWADALLIAETVADPDGRWMARAEQGLAPGRYTLRVEALDEDGAVTAVASSPFTRENAAGAPAPGQIVVQPGDSLWRIAHATYGRGVRYTVIYEANAGRIRNPDLIYPGQVFTLPPPAR
ncbi:MAG: LysM peptidoglycan-binding domain-containing protein [Rubrimonas sp.]